MIARGESDDVPLEAFAHRLGVSGRHLRRLFEEHLGASPIDVAISKRLHLAKQLLAQSDLPVTEVAFASGFRSIRRFNEVFKEKFRSSPSSFRESAPATLGGSDDFIHFEIPLIAPFAWGHIYQFLENHGARGVECFIDGCYRRTFSIEKSIGALEVKFDPKKCQLLVAITASDPRHLRTIIEKVRDLFDTRLNPHAHLDDLNPQDPIAACYVEALGIRVPGAWEPFETAICIVLGQLVSTEQARSKVGTLIEHFGTAAPNPVFDGCSRLFPTAKSLAEGDLRVLGLTKVREAALRELSQQVDKGEIDLSRSADIAKTKAQLLAIKGIGPWTVEMIAMRCLGDTNAFPKTDLIVKRALDLYENKNGDWSPWNSYIALALWQKFAVNLSKKRRG